VLGCGAQKNFYQKVVSTQDGGRRRGVETWGGRLKCIATVRGSPAAEARENCRMRRRGGGGRARRAQKKRKGGGHWWEKIFEATHELFLKVALKGGRGEF